MTESALAVASLPSTPPREVKIAIYLQAILFLRVIVTGVVAYTLFGETRGHPITAVLILLLLAGIWSLWLCGLWWRLNWVRWLTVIFHAFVVCDVLRRDLVHGRGPDFLGYVLLGIQVAVIVIFLRPVASHWYRRQAG
jgi:hypothetical protein